MTYTRECDWKKEIRKFREETLSSNEYLKDLGIVKRVAFSRINYPKADTVTKHRCIEAAEYYQNIRYT